MYFTMKNGKALVWRIIGCTPLLALGFLAACSQTLGGFTPVQLAAVNCVLAQDGATVIAIAKPGLAVPANGLAVVGCDAGTQIGAIIGAGK